MKRMPKLIKKSERLILPTYKRQPVAFRSGKGAVLIDVDGKKYIDFLSGIAVTNLGHDYAPVTKAIQKQAKKLLHVSNIFVLPESVELAERLLKLSKLKQAFFCNSGTEANEAAIKLARHAAIAISGNDKKIEIICAENSFHGRTLGSLSATMQPAYQKGVGPLVPGFVSVPFNDSKAIERAITPQTCAIMLETMQAEGGMNIPDTQYFRDVQRICRERGVFLILDEVQVGNGRTGKYFAYEHYGIQPDVVTLAKGLASGVPIGACLVSDVIAQTIQPGIHASTFGGNPFAAAAALATVNGISKPSMLKKVSQDGQYLLGLAAQIQKRFPSQIKSVRGMGFFVALEFHHDVDGAALVASGLEHGIVINVVKNRVIRLVPPFVMSRSQMKKGMDILAGVIASV